jgi:hypothetical protein
MSCQLLDDTEKTDQVFFALCIRTNTLWTSALVTPDARPVDVVERQHGQPRLLLLPNTRHYSVIGGGRGTRAGMRGWRMSHLQLLQLLSKNLQSFSVTEENKR